MRLLSTAGRGFDGWTRTPYRVIREAAPVQRTAIRRCVLAGIVVLLTVASLPAVQASPAVSDSGSAPDPVSVQSTGQGSDVPFDSDDGEEGELEEDENGADEDEDEDGISIVGEWWGLGGEASEAPYIGLVELGVTVLAVGVTGYSLGTALVVVAHVVIAVGD